MRCSTSLPLWSLVTACILGYAAAAIEGDCYEDSREYMGKISQTEDGLECSRWDKPPIPYPDREFPDGSATAAANYCRDPDNSRRLWCFTVQGNWGYCHVPRCQKQNCYQDGVPWEGTIDWTVSNRRCQRWDVGFPHIHHYRDLEVLPEKNLTGAENYCRVVGLGVRAPWCYTTDPSVEWEICPVPKCPKGNGGIYVDTPTKLPTLTTACYKDSNVYSGQLPKTLSGRYCQRWDAQEPHQHNMTDPLAFPDDIMDIGKAENYCRDPGNKGFPWCYTSDPNVRFEPCNVPSCGSGDCFDVPGKFMGNISHTLEGVECRRWDELSKPFDDHLFPDGSATAAANNCRDPGGTKGAPWCYTIYVNQAYCPVPRCHLQSCYTSAATWMGKTSVTVSGRTCQRWDSQDPHGHGFTNPNAFPEGNLSLAENHCRDPDLYGKPWCLTTDEKKQWEECAVQRCEEEYCWSGNSMTYKGTVSNTISGLKCQMWVDQTPHTHNIIDSADESLAEAKNHCRDPSNRGAPWCYTMDKNVEWEFCAIPRCPHDKKEPKIQQTAEQESTMLV